MAERVAIRVNDHDVEDHAGKQLLHAIMDAGIPIATACGGQGSCHLCRVLIRDGHDRLPQPNAIERKALGNVLIAQGMRLACQIRLAQPLTLEVPAPRQRRGRSVAAKTKKRAR
jgi:adenylate cyclase